MELAKPVKIKAEVMWCFHNKQNEMSNKYQVDLCNLSEGAVKAIQNLGLEVRKRDDKPEKGYFITAKSSIPIKVFSQDGDDLAEVAIGNGSKAVVLLSSYEWQWKNKSGCSASIKKMVIEELHSYDGEDSSSEDDDDIL
jgi:hypothetical protein